MTITAGQADSCLECGADCLSAVQSAVPVCIAAGFEYTQGKTGGVCSDWLKSREFYSFIQSHQSIPFSPRLKLSGNYIHKHDTFHINGTLFKGYYDYFLSSTVHYKKHKQMFFSIINFFYDLAPT